EVAGVSVGCASAGVTTLPGPAVGVPGSTVAVASSEPPDCATDVGLARLAAVAESTVEPLAIALAGRDAHPLKATTRASAQAMEIARIDSSRFGVTAPCLPHRRLPLWRGTYRAPFYTNVSALGTLLACQVSPDADSR